MSALKPKPCEYCRAPSLIRYRIVHEAGGEWQLVCPDCQERLSADNGHYRYGGTWKARRKTR